MNLSSSMIALSILSGSPLSALPGGVGDDADVPPIEGPKARAAKKAFTTVKAPAPWEAKGYKPADPAQLAAVRAMRSIIDDRANDLPTDPDLRATFTAYRALDRLQVLAQAAAKPGVTALDRALLERSFDRGLAQLKSFIETSKTDKLTLYYGQASASVQSFSLATPTYMSSGVGDVVARDPNAALPGLTGSEIFEVKIGVQGGTRDTVKVDLSAGPQPPTLKSVVASINAAIAAVPDRLSDGTILHNADGSVRSRWSTRFEVREVSTGKYALAFSLSPGELASIGEQGADNAVLASVARHGKSEADALQLRRFNEPQADLSKSSVVAKDVSVDRAATARAAAEIDAKEAQRKSVVKDHVKPDPTVNAGLSVHASASDADGNSYLVGTAQGDYGSIQSTGTKSLFLTKVDSGGHILWRRALGSASDVDGTAVSVDAEGNVSVAGSVAEKKAEVGFIGHDADLLVAKFSTSGEQLVRTTVENPGADAAKAITTDADGNILVAGSTADSAGQRHGVIVKVDASGKVTQRKKLDGVDEVRSLVTDADGRIVAVTREGDASTVRRYDADLAGEEGHYSLGANVQATTLGLAGDGRIVVAGSADASVSGDQANTRGGGRDAFVTTLAADLSTAKTSYVGGASDESADSITFAGDDVYVGGRTFGAIDGSRRGVVDGFVARVSLSDGHVGAINQFGAQDDVVGSVQLTTIRGGSNHLGFLGLSSGELAPKVSGKIVGQTGIKPADKAEAVWGDIATSGDTFRVQVDGGAVKTIAFDRDETLVTLRDKVKKILGKAAMVSLLRDDHDNASLKISALAGHRITLLAGKVTADRGDALAKLGLTAGSFSTPESSAEVKVRPGGRYGLSLGETLSLGTKESATEAAQALAAAAANVKTAYGSLFWNATKAQIADGRKGGSSGGSPADLAKLASYKDALARLSAGNNSSPLAALI